MFSDKVLKRKISHLPKIDRALIKSAQFIDNIDMYLGPFAEAAQLSSSEAMNQIGYAADIFQYCFLKAPFVVTYMARTRDLSAFAEWIPREMFAIGIPYGGIVEVLRNYESSVLRYYKIKK